MSKDSGKRALEKYKIFPYVAWTLTAVFAIFVYNITTELQAVTHDLQKQAEALEAKIEANDPNVDFDALHQNRLSSGDEE